MAGRGGQRAGVDWAMGDAVPHAGLDTTDEVKCKPKEARWTRDGGRW